LNISWENAELCILPTRHSTFRTKGYGSGSLIRPIGEEEELSVSKRIAIDFDEVKPPQNTKADRLERHARLFAIPLHARVQCGSCSRSKREA
jgi:hypothetical protein